jgi:hypothetical protein
VRYQSNRTVSDTVVTISVTVPTGATDPQRRRTGSATPSSSVSRPEHGWIGAVMPAGSPD